MNLENPDEIYSWDIEQLWNCLKTMMDELDENDIPIKESYKKEINLVEYGISMRIPIWYFTNNWYEEYPSSKKVKILGHGKYLLNDFIVEKEERERIIREIILNNLEDSGITKPR